MDETKEILPAETGAAADTDTAAVEDDALAKLKAEHEEKLRQVRIDGEVRYMLARMGAKNPALAAKALDLTGVQADEGGVSGVEESVKRLMASDPYLFGFGRMAASGGEASSGTAHGEYRRDPDTLSDREYYDMLLKR